MGTLSPATLALDGWLGWDGTLGVRVLSGFAYFQGGKVRFTLMVDEDSLVDVRVEAPRMPPDWFQGPSSTDEYAEQARMLVQSVFAGDIDAAHQLFSRRYQPLVTREILQELSSKIRSDLGNEITKTSLQGTSVAPTATDEGGMTLTVAHLLVTTDGKECISHVNFVFPVGGNTISRGHLASIFVRKSWTTSHPQLVQLTEQTLMHALQPTAEKGQFLEEFQQYFHPGVVPHLRTTGLADRLTQAQDEWQGMDGTADWNAWQVEIVGENLSAVGWVPVARHGYLEEGPSQGCVEAKLDFSDGKLIGLTLVGPSFSFSTLNMVEGLGSTAEVGRLFWGEVLRGRADAAHQRMSQALRTQLPLADFEKIVDDAKLTQAAQLQSIELNAVRYCDRINRQQAIMFSCYYVAVRTDGSSQPLQCDFAVSDDESDKSLALMNFNADFTHNFPVDGEAVGQRVLTSFISGVPQAVIELVAPEDRREIDERLLRIFLSQLKMQLATTELPIRYSLMNIYSPNGCGQELRTAFDSGEAALPFSANLKRGQLKAFHFSSPKLSRFVEHLEDREVITNVAEQFLNQWLNDNDLEMAAGRLVPALRTAATAQRLTALRTSLNPVSEDKITFHLASWDLHETENRIITEFEIFGVPQEKRIELVIEVDAFAARIYSIRVVESQR
jgi:hypothetical protein